MCRLVGPGVRFRRFGRQLHWDLASVLDHSRVCRRSPGVLLARNQGRSVKASATHQPAPKKAGFLFAMIRRKPSLHANSEDTDKARSAPRVGIPVRVLSFPKQGFAGNVRHCGAFEFPRQNQPSFDLLEAPESPTRHAVAPYSYATRSTHDLCQVLGDPHPGFGREPRSDV